MRLPPSRQEIVAAIVAGTASLELAKGECRRLAPLKDLTYGYFKIEGNALPAFSYQVFDKPLMEFVQVIAHVGLPDRISFEATTEDLGEVTVKRAYEAPFHILSRHLHRYFPLLAEGKEPPREL